VVKLFIPILYQDPPNLARNKPQRHREHREVKKQVDQIQRGYSKRNGITIYLF
jgi:hypothetical protein